MTEHRLKQTTDPPVLVGQSFGEKESLTKSIYTTTKKPKVFLPAFKCMEIPASKF